MSSLSRRISITLNFLARMVNALSFDSSDRSSHTRSHTFSFISWRNVSYFSTLCRTAFIIEPMRKIPKDFQRIVDSDLKLSRQPESTDSERISFDLRRGKREPLPAGGCSFLPTVATDCLGKIRTKPCRLTVPNCVDSKISAGSIKFA